MPYEGGLLPLVWLSGALAVPVLLLALAALMVAAVRAVRLWRATRHGDEVLQRIAVLGREGRLDDALRVVRETPGAASAVARPGLEAPTAETAEQAMEQAAQVERRRLRRGLSVVDWLGTLAVLVPGAVLVVGEDPVPALAALALGLGVAMAVTLARWGLAAGFRRAVLDMERAAAVVREIRG